MEPLAALAFANLRDRMRMCGIGMESRMSSCLNLWVNQLSYHYENCGVCIYQLQYYINLYYNNYYVCIRPCMRLCLHKCMGFACVCMYLYMFSAGPSCTTMILYIPKVAI